MADTHDIAYSLGAQKVAGGWLSRCPCCNYKTPTFSISTSADSKTLFHCFGGCDSEEVLHALRRRGLWRERRDDAYSYRPSRKAQKHQNESNQDGTKAAAIIWRATLPASGSLLEKYLNYRGITLSPPPTLRFHPGLRHPTCATWPAMVALVSRDGDDEPKAIHRTFLARDGLGKAPVQPAKMTLGTCGGRAARLAPTGNTLIVGEGIESVLSAMQLWGLPGWAALSAGGLSHLSLAQVPKQVIIAADNDRAGLDAAYRLQQRLLASDRQARIFKPASGNDFNDYLKSLRGAG